MYQFLMGVSAYFGLLGVHPLTAGGHLFFFSSQAQQFCGVQYELSGSWGSSVDGLAQMLAPLSLAALK